MFCDLFKVASYSLVRCFEKAVKAKSKINTLDRKPWSRLRCGIYITPKRKKSCLSGVVWEWGCDRLLAEAGSVVGRGVLGSGFRSHPR